jgi:methyl-accepting chemotaxis protein
VALVEAKVQERMQGVVLSIVGIAAVVLLLIAAAGMLLANTILRPLNLMKANLDDIAAGEGDLTRRLTITTQDELGAQTSRSLADLGRRLGQLVGQFRI